MVKELEGKLQEQVYARSGLESKEQDMQRQRDALMLELQELKEVNGKLLSQVRRSEGEGQEDVVQSVNGDHVDDTLKQLNKVQEFEGIVTEKDKHIVMLQGDLYNQQLLVKSLSDDVAQHTERSGALSDELEREKANASALCEEEKRKSGALCEELEREKQNASALCEQFEEEKRKSGALCEELEREKQNASALCEQFEEEKQKSGALCEELEREKQNASAISGDAEQQKQDNSAVSEQLQQQMRDHGALCEQLEEEKRKSGALYGQLDEERQKSGALGGELENERRTCGTLCGELEQQKQKNNTLRERNWKAMEAITATERAASERVAAAVKSEKELMEKALSEHQEEREQLLARALSQQREDTRTLLCRVFPDISIADTDDQSIFLSEFETQACEALERLKADSHDNLKEEVLKRELSNALARSEKIEGRVQHYKTVLSDTEAMLTELQSSVEAEEKKWKEKLDSVEADLGQERREKHLLQGKLEEVKTAAEGVIELQEKLKVLQVKLKAEEIDREHLKEQLRESNARLSERQTDLESKTTELHDAQQTLGKTDELQQEVTVLRLKVDEEFQGNKQLAQQVIKLTGIVKTGQDALRHEQEHVRRLQAQLQQSNGVASAGGDIDSLKLKVAEQEKQLEQEIMTNKHLTAQLAGSRNAESI
ncbi:PREDICTED: kinectin-like isoform X1 [Priapulus caudatus]|uniref:Kinectin-like isoform X1 n=1 Tax=Priapulus caudatus TaxID=37621 RepID=A0ABM1F2M3_PRICU|nr:PREDICTED: kinectin-like isoform X1 [Priapulus caudatus]